jgi:hypothetical protein
MGPALSGYPGRGDQAVNVERHRQKQSTERLIAGVGSGDSRPTAVAQLTDVLRDSPAI